MQSQPWNTIQIWKSSSWTIFQGIAWLNREFVQLLFTLQISKQEHNLQISFTTFKFPWQQTHSVYSHFLPPKNSTWGKCQLSEQFSLCYPPPFWTPKPETPWCVPWNCRGHAVSCGEVNLIQALDGHGKRQGPIFVMWFHSNLQPDLPYTKRGNLLGGNHPSSWKIKYNSLGLTAIHDLKPELVTEWKCSQTSVPPSWMQCWVCATWKANCCPVLFLEIMLSLWQSFSQVIYLYASSPCT